MEAQPGDTPEPVFSYRGSRAMHPKQLPCWITHTNQQTHDIIRSGFDRSPDVYRRDRRRGPALLPLHRGQDHRFADKESTRSSWSRKA